MPEITLAQLKQAKRLDAEYFQSQAPLTNSPQTSLADLCECIHTGPAGSLLPASSYTATGTPVLRPSNLDEITSNTNNLVYIPPALIKQNQLHLYQHEDILFSRIGNIKCALIYKQPPVTISPNLVGLRVKKSLLDPYFLLIFLHSQQGQQQLHRGVKIVSLASLDTNHIANVQIPIFPLSQQKKLGKNAQQALKKDQQAKKLLKKATEQVNQVFKSSPPPQNTQQTLTFATIQPHKRLDAEFFFFSQKITADKTIKLGAIAKIWRGTEVGRQEYQTHGSYFWRVSNISQLGLIPKSQKYINEQQYQLLATKYQPQKNEILLVKDGKPGICCVFTEEKKGILSDGIVRLKLKDFDPYYIAACINADFCQQQIKQHLDGTLVPHWKITHIQQLQIPLLPVEKQKVIANLLKQAYKAQLEKKKLWEKARTEIEEIIQK